MSEFDAKYKALKEKIPTSRFHLAIQQLLLLQEMRPICLFGLGTTAYSLLKFLRKMGVNVSLLCDSQKKGENIISPSILVRDFANAVVIIGAPAHYEEIFEQLLNMGINRNNIFQRIAYGSNIMSEAEFEEFHYNGYKWAYQMCQDNKSKKVIIEAVKTIIINEPLDIICDSETYFESSIINFATADDEVFVDAGAYQGETAIAFYKTRQDKTYSFEPDSINYAICKENLRLYPNAFCINAGLWISSQNLGFVQQGSGGSKISDETTSQSVAIDVVSLDDYFANISTKPTFIKMDIEGAEKEALFGAKTIIKKYKPKLAICVYHKPEDIYEIPRIILSFRDDYKLYFRQYEEFADTVVYAV